MRLEIIFDKIETGYNVIEKHLRKNFKGKEFVYLTMNNISEEGTIQFENSAYVATSILRKFYRRNIQPLEYGDYLLCKKKGRFHIIRFCEMDFKVIPNTEFIVFREGIQYFDNAIKDKQIYKYFQERLLDFEYYYDSKSIFIDKIKSISIDVNKISPSEKPHETKSYRKQELNPNLIKIEDNKLTLMNLVNRIREKKINLFTDFQREGDLWEKKYQSRLIESILIKLPIPSFYFDVSDDNNWLIIDGLQRISAIKNFIENKLPLQDLEYLKDLNEKTYNQLPRAYQLNFGDYNVRAVMLEKGTPQQIKYSLFERINTGGLVLTSQEIRHALNQSNPEKPDRNPAAYLKQLSDKKIFKRIWEGKPKKRMQDRETILRYLAFRIAKHNNYVPDMKDFLDVMMTELYNVSDYLLKQLEEEFEKALKTCVVLFGKENDKEVAFRRYSEKGQRIFSNPLFEVFCYFIGQLDDKEINSLKDKRDIFREKYFVLLKDKAFIDAISDNTKNSVFNRFQKVSDLLNEFK